MCGFDEPPERIEEPPNGRIVASARGRDHSAVFFDHAHGHHSYARSVRCRCLSSGGQRADDQRRGRRGAQQRSAGSAAGGSHRFPRRRDASGLRCARGLGARALPRVRTRGRRYVHGHAPVSGAGRGDDPGGVRRGGHRRLPCRDGRNNAVAHPLGRREPVPDHRGSRSHGPGRPRGVRLRGGTCPLRCELLLAGHHADPHRELPQPEQQPQRDRHRAGVGSCLPLPWGCGSR